MRYSSIDDFEAGVGTILLASITSKSLERLLDRPSSLQMYAQDDLEVSQ